MVPRNFWGKACAVNVLGLCSQTWYHLVKIEFPPTLFQGCFWNKFEVTGNLLMTLQCLIELLPKVVCFALFVSYSASRYWSHQPFGLIPARYCSLVTKDLVGVARRGTQSGWPPSHFASGGETRWAAFGGTSNKVSFLASPFRVTEQARECSLWSILITWFGLLLVMMLLIFYWFDLLSFTYLGVSPIELCCQWLAAVSEKGICCGWACWVEMCLVMEHWLQKIYV